MRHLKSNSHKHKGKYGIVDKEYEFNKPAVDEIDYVLDTVIKDSRGSLFHSIEYRCANDFKFTNIAKKQEVKIAITYRYMIFKSEILRLNRNIKNARNNGIRFNEMINLTIKIDSSLSHINIC